MRASKGSPQSECQVRHAHHSPAHQRRMPVPRNKHCIPLQQAAKPQLQIPASPTSYSTHWLGRGAHGKTGSRPLLKCTPSTRVHFPGPSAWDLSSPVLRGEMCQNPVILISKTCPFLTNDATKLTPLLTLTIITNVLLQYCHCMMNYFIFFTEIGILQCQFCNILANIFNKIGQKESGSGWQLVVVVVVSNIPLDLFCWGLHGSLTKCPAECD